MFTTLLERSTDRIARISRISRIDRRQWLATALARSPAIQLGRGQVMADADAGQLLICRRQAIRQRVWS